MIFPLIQYLYVFENREQMLQEEVIYAGLPRQFKDEEVVCEEDIPTDTTELGNDQYDSEETSDVFIGPVAKGYFVRLQTELY